MANIRSRCKKYTPASMPELTIFYMTMPDEVDICDADINGGEISECLYKIVVDDRRAELEAEIEAHERKEAEAQAADQAGEAWEAERRVA